MWTILLFIVTGIYCMSASILRLCSEHPLRPAWYSGTDIRFCYQTWTTSPVECHKALSLAQFISWMWSPAFTGMYLSAKFVNFVVANVIRDVHNSSLYFHQILVAIKLEATQVNTILSSQKYKVMFICSVEIPVAPPVLTWHSNPLPVVHWLRLLDM